MSVQEFEAREDELLELIHEKLKASSRQWQGLNPLRKHAIGVAIQSHRSFRQILSPRHASCEHPLVTSRAAA